ncbi:MAG: hypothetical protein WBE86_05530 [Candidatus Acidiferrales bacterium]
MKKLSNVLGLAAALLFTLGLASNASAKSHTWTGWISNAMCGAKDASAAKADCTRQCVQKSDKYVFVNTKTQKVYPITNQDAVTDSAIGSEVTLTGELNKDGSIKVDSIAPKSGS